MFRKRSRQKHPLEVVRFPSLLTFGCKSKKCGTDAEKQWHKTGSLLKLLTTQFGIQYFLICVINIAWTQIDSVLSPLGLSRLVAYFTPNQTKISNADAYHYAVILIILNCANFIITGNQHVWQTVLGTKMQTSLKSLLYRKSLKLPSSFSTGANLGNLVTIITKDVRFVEQNLWIVKDFVKFVIQYVTVAYLMWRRIGNAAFVGLGLICAALPLQVYLSTKLKSMRFKVGKSSDDRLQRIQETLSAIKIIKMYTWERFFYNRISESRKNEVKELMNVFLVNYIIMTIGMVISKITFLVMIISYIWMGYETNAELIFYILSLFNRLTMSFGRTLPINFSRTAQLYASFMRLDKLLKIDELEKNSPEYMEKPSVRLRGVSLKLNGKTVLESMSVSVTEPGLTIVTGPVGSGKSSLLKVLLKEYKAEGSVRLDGDLSYASQEPWLFPATIEDNILLGEKYDKLRYDEVIRVCALEYDFAHFDENDQTLVADNGQNLSKGQQARINLARAVYRNSNIYILDDPLAALDNHVRTFIFNECILNFLRDKICIMVSQNTDHIGSAENVIFLNNGKMVYNEDTQIVIESNNSSTAPLLEISKSKETHEVDIKNDRSLAMLETEQQQSERNIYHEVRKEGQVGFNVYKIYFQYGGGLRTIIRILFLYGLAQACDSSSDKMLSKWVDLQQKVLDLKQNSNYTEYDFQTAVSDKENAFYLYGFLTVLRCIMNLVKFYALLMFCRSASLKLHEAMTSRVIGTTMAFFDNYYIGNILNRFSYDLNTVDEFLPILFPILGATLFAAAGSLVLIATVNWFFLLPAIIFLALLVLVRIALMPTARSLKRLEAATRSPVVGHMNCSLQGLPTIRAFNAEQTFKKEFDKHQDLYTSALLSLNISMTAFSFFMDAMSAFLTILVVARFLLIEHSSSAGNVGLALSQVVMFTHMLKATVRIWSELENNMTSVERSIEYTELRQEFKNGLEMKGWPSEGALKFKNVALSYEGCKTPILKGISFNVLPKQKIAIVGRTGAGKSSIISVLYRLYEFDGSIEIDGVDIKKLSLENLRRNISIIPQEPVLFQGSIRQNIDPEEKYSNDVIRIIMQKIGITDFAPHLNTVIESNSFGLSTGQKQLICLARAAISKCKILVLDEATANMDAETDKKLHIIINEIFSECTVISITHRLISVFYCDKVLVLDCGDVVEFDNPNDLYKNINSRFYRMCKENRIVAQ